MKDRAVGVFSILYHIHILVETPPKYSPATVVRMLNADSHID